MSNELKYLLNYTKLALRMSNLDWKIEIDNGNFKKVDGEYQCRLFDYDNQTITFYKDNPEIHKPENIERYSKNIDNLINYIKKLNNLKILQAACA